MVPECDMCQFLTQKPLQNQILTTDYWTVGIVPNQQYLGRALVTLLTHKSSLGKLSQEEWADFEIIVPKLEAAYKRAFGAEPLNIGNYMNHAYRAEPPHPHVHWHIFPRYKKPVELGAMKFDDPSFGNFYDDKAERIVSEEVISLIADKLKQLIAV